MNAARLLAVALTTLSLGCSAEPGFFKNSMEVRAAAPAAKALAESSDATPQLPQEADKAPPANVPRKIIYTASVDLVAEDLDKVEPQVPRIVQTFGGYISKQDLSGATGSFRRASWTVRVPIDKFDAFLDAVAALGETQRRTLDTQDVTDKFFDTEARLKNKRVEESRLLKLLEERTGKLDEVIQVERELSRVRAEIEQLDGSLRLLTNLTSLSTVTITVSQRRADKPPESPLFGTVIGRTFFDSLDALIAVGKSIVLMVVALAPWLPFVLVAYFLLRFLLRRALMPRGRGRVAPASEAFLPRA